MAAAVSVTQGGININYGTAGSGFGAQTTAQSPNQTPTATATATMGTAGTAGTAATGSGMSLSTILVVAAIGIGGFVLWKFL